MNSEVSFEEAMDKLKDIVEKLESGQNTLDGSVKLYEEGMEIAAACKGILKKAEQKITLLNTDQEKRDEDICQ